jgi:hypothetical protein
MVPSFPFTGSLLTTPSAIRSCPPVCSEIIKNLYSSTLTLYH